MNAAKVYLAEAWHELATGLKSSLVPMMFVGLVGYLFVMLASAETLREMGGADVARNSPVLVFLMMSGQSFWLIFIWAWVFARVVTRDRKARLLELVLCSPVSLRGLIFARYAGAVALAVVLGTSSAIGFWLVPVLAAFHVFPPESIGPTPHMAILWGWVLFVLPSAIGLGALYVSAALRTKSSVGPFVAASIVLFVWMIAMIVLRGGDMNEDIATLIDVTGFGEADLQTKHWTPAEKATNLLALTGPLLLNRLVWMLVPLGLLGIVTARIGRESLVTERPTRRTSSNGAAVSRSTVKTLSLPSEPTQPSWVVATLSETAWNLGRTLRGWPFWIAAIFCIAMNIASAFFHVVRHAEGPLLPRAELLVPFLVQLFYLFSVFAVAGFVGALVRRDDQPGFDQILDASTAPTGVRVVGRGLATLSLTLIIALLPAPSAWLVEAMGVGSVDVWMAVLVNALVVAPALFEIAALTFLFHSLVRSAGTAHALSMFAAFVAVVNHEIGIVVYPPGQFGVTMHLSLSSLTGWSSWLPQLLELGATKVALGILLVGLAWLVCPRGTDYSPRTRLREALVRARGGAGALTAVGLLALVLGQAELYQRIIVRGEFMTLEQDEAEDAEWESRFWNQRSTFSLRGGEVEAKVNLDRAQVDVVWRLHEVSTASHLLHGDLRPGMRIVSARVDGVDREVTQALDFFALDLGVPTCARCEIELNVRIGALGWYDDEDVPWLTSTGAWIRAEDILPRLGHDPDRILLSPSVRRRHGLNERPKILEPKALTSSLGVAPRGAWRWSVAFSEPGVGTTSTGRTNGPLDFAVAWTPRTDTLSARQAETLTVWHGLRFERTAEEIMEDVEQGRACVQGLLGIAPELSEVIQAPRNRGTIALHGFTLWIPEDAGWDVAAQGVGRFKRQAAIAASLAARTIVDRADLRSEPGSRWLTDGVAGWIGFECLRTTEGDEAWLAVLNRRADAVAEALGALDTPLVGLADDGDAAWVREYAPLATSTWAQSIGPMRALTIVRQLADQIRNGVILHDSLTEIAGADATAALLGAPHATELSIVRSPGRSPRAQGEQFRWESGGWVRATGTFAATQRFARDASPSRSVQIPAELSPEKSFVVFDAIPSYERSPLNNRWQPERAPTGQRP